MEPESPRTERGLQPSQAKSSFVFFAFLLSGLSFNMPLFCLTAAVDYYQTRFPNTAILIDMVVVRQVLSLPAICLSNASIELVSPLVRIMSSYLAFVVLMVFITVCDVQLNLFGDHLAYGLTLLVTAALALAQAVQEASLYGYANLMPSRYTEAVVLGEGVSALLVSGLRVLTKLALSGERRATVVFYLICVLILVACWIIFWAATRTELVKSYAVIYHGSNPLPPADQTVDTPESPLDPQGGEAAHPTLYSSLDDGEDATPSCPLVDGDSLDARRTDGEVPRAASAPLADDDDTRQNSEVRRRSTRPSWKERLGTRYQVCKQIYRFMLALFINYLVTATLFPGIVSEVVSCSLGTWMAVILIAAYNVCDTIGRIAISSNKLQRCSRRFYLVGPAFRVVFIPLVLLCLKPRVHPVLSGEAWPIAVTGLLGLTHGYLCLMPFSHAPTRVQHHQREICGNLMVLSLAVATVMGSGLSVVLDQVFLLHESRDVVCNVTHGGTNVSLDLSTADTHSALLL